MQEQTTTLQNHSKSKNFLHESMHFCEESIFLTNNLGGRTEYAADVELEDDGITVYRQKPEEADYVV